jgi:hypothetical protein
MVGLISFQSTRRTWTLTRGATRARLEVACQNAAKGGRPAALRLDGEENQEAVWLPRDAAAYAGAETGKRPLSYRLALVGDPGRGSACRVLPQHLVLSCVSSRVQVRRAGATLVAGEKGPRWSPAAREDVASLRCDARGEDDDDVKWVALWPDAAFEFAPGRHGSPGLEFAFENSDMVLQDGGYRWMP